jgi:methylmalonyl-CoA mutase cobalamin-binding domain/chain
MDGTRPAGAPGLDKQGCGTPFGPDRLPQESPDPMSGQIRALLAAVGLQDSACDMKGMARALRDAGIDVIYAGSCQTSDEVVNAAVQEDVDVLGLSLASGSHAAVFPVIFARLHLEGAEDMIVLTGGAVRDEDAETLRKMGVKEVMSEDAPPQAMVDMLKRLVDERGPR